MERVCSSASDRGSDYKGLGRAQSGTDASRWVLKITEPIDEFFDTTQGSLMIVCVKACV
jgi:hypothetical protein